MTQEEKAKRYDRALERAKEQSSKHCLDKIVLEDIFPELKESEDERIRKELLNAFQESEESLYMVLTPHRRASFIAWLEKQGEQKPAEWSEEDAYCADYILTNCMYYAEVSGYVDEKNNREIHQKAKKWLNSITYKNGWKPSEEQMADLWNMVCECRPADQQLLQDLYFGLKTLRGE